MGNVLAAKERTSANKSVLTAIRRNGGIPAVVYGNNMESTPIEVNTKALHKTLQHSGKNGIIELEIGNNKLNVLLMEYQMDSLKNEFIHADFLAVNLTKKLTTNAALNLTGAAQGTKEGGVLQQSLFEVAVTARPKDLPDTVDVDVSALNIGDTITVGDIRDQIAVTLENGDEEVIASVLAPRVEETASSEETTETEGTPENQ